METAVRYEKDSEAYRVKHAVPSQNVFRYVTKRAESIGMKVNKGKTSVLCVSDALKFHPEAFFEDTDGTRLSSGGHMKMLGFHMSSRPTVHAHIEVIRRRFRSRLWVLRHLRAAGFTQEELVKVYKSIIRPIPDYLAVVYHSMMTDEMDEILERLQSQALKSIYGWKIPYAQLREMSGVPTLRQRRIDMVDKFVAKCVKSPLFAHWFPKRRAPRVASRTGEVYQEFFARCDCLRNSPLFYMRRRLNGKIGKTYGERNKKYRNTEDDGIHLRL